MKRMIYLLAGIFLLFQPMITARAADEISVTVNNVNVYAWRAADLEKAKKQAGAEDKPIAWIVSEPEYLKPGKISTSSPQGATLHAFFALRERAVLVFEDGAKQDNEAIKVVDDAVHTQTSHPMLPVIVFLNPEATKVLTKVKYQSDFVKRAYALGGALREAENKLSVASDPPNQ